MRKIKTDDRIKLSGDILDVDVGLVTGRNEFFMIDEQTATKNKINAYTKKVVGRSNHLKGVVFTEADFAENAENNIEGYLFLPPDKAFEDLPKACKEYIQFGEQNDFHTGYKCRIRKRWYITPSLWTPDAFALRQVGEYPKLIINKSEACSTDTVHRAKFKRKVNKELVAVSFLNSLTFAFSEITGRSYGGGVLTFEPTEIEDLPLPLLASATVNVKEIDKLIRAKKIEEVLDIVDQELLIKQLKFKRKDVQLLRLIWRKLSDRRQNRK
ncbi:MAG: hypothetical protein QM726_04240 [Chitinophagaceae bacterium]